MLRTISIHLYSSSPMAMSSSSPTIVPSSSTPTNGKTVREYRTCSIRNYSSLGMSALLTMKLNTANPEKVDVEVVVCGGNSPDAFMMVDPKHSKDKVFLPPLQDCWRMKVLDPNAQWEREHDMSSRRTMGDLLHLTTGDLLFINDAKNGTSCLEDAEEPNYTRAAMVSWRQKIAGYASMWWVMQMPSRPLPPLHALLLSNPPPFPSP